MSEEIEDLERLNEKTDEFIQDIFDWVSSLGQVHLLQNLYDFKSAIRNELKNKKEQSRSKCND